MNPSCVNSMSAAPRGPRAEKLTKLGAAESRTLCASGSGCRLLNRPPSCSERFGLNSSWVVGNRVVFKTRVPFRVLFIRVPFLCWGPKKEL